MTITYYGGPHDGQALLNPDKYQLPLDDTTVETRVLRSWFGVWHVYQLTADRTVAVYVGPEVRQWGGVDA